MFTSVMWSDFETNSPESLLDLDLFDTFSSEGMALLDCLNSWSGKPIHQWQPEEVLDFIYESITSTCVGLEKFRCISGYIFSNLTLENCKLLSNSNDIGEIIYNAKETYMRCHQSEASRLDEVESVFDNSSNDSLTPYRRSTDRDVIALVKPKKPGRPKTKQIRRDRIRKRSQKLWEFLLNLLRDTDTCPQLIKWDNFDEGTFKFVQSDKVARLWGSRKKNDNMTYEKFSRAMRYYYKSQVLLPVPGRRLVYKFGPHAKGWKTVQPIN